jgi:hypothetical protein
LGHHFFNDGALTDANVRRRFEELHDELSGVIRRGDRYFVDSFVPRRKAIVLAASSAEGLFTLFSVDGARRYGGQVTSGQSLSLLPGGRNGTIYYTVDGRDPLEFADSFFLPLVDESSPREFLIPKRPVSDSSGNGQGAGYWLKGTGGIGYQNHDNGRPPSTLFDPFINLDVGRQMFGISSSCYVRIPFQLDAESMGQFDTLMLKMRYDDGFVAFINGIEVARRNAPESLAWDSRATDNREDALAVALESVDISAHVDALKAGENLLVIHGLNSGSRSSDFLISPELSAYQGGSGRELSPTARAYDGSIRLANTLQVKARTRDGATWSALSEAVFSTEPVRNGLRITEIMYHPPDRAAEFIELQNVADEPLDLSGIRFAEGVEFVFPPGVLQPGAVVVLVREQHEADFRLLYPDIEPFGRYRRALNDAGERVSLLASDGVTVLDSVAFENSAPWPEAANGKGRSLERIFPADPGTGPDAWRASSLAGGSPGETPLRSPH